jgi:uncharacterized protein
MNFDQWFSSQFPHIPLSGAHAAISLSEAGGTIPFIARYRKEQTGNLDEVAIEQAIQAQARWKQIGERKTFILSEIEAQGKLTDSLRGLLEGTFDLTALEDIYLPYKRKKKTKATLAKEAGLEPLAEWIWRSGHEVGFDAGETPESRAKQFLNPEAKIETEAAALEGAHYILVERLSESQDLRQFVRTELLERGILSSSKGEKAKEPSKFDRYFDYHELVSSLRKGEHSHRYLALRRGEAEGELQVRMGGGAEDESFQQRLLRRFEEAACCVERSTCAALLKKSARFALKYHVYLSIEAEIHTMLKEVADDAAITVFADNVRTVLLGSPFGARTVLGVDPGLRTGCKLALVDKAGGYVASAVVHTLGDGDRAKARSLIKELSQKAGLEAIAVGNGTGGREAEEFFRALVKEQGLSIPVALVSEAGASVYSASEIARREFPELDLTVRGAISIARRFQDPLAELVKVDPKSIGVGQYQHDVNQQSLKTSLERVVESCVNAVGVNLNTASEYLLSFVSGIGPALAKGIVEFRGQKGLFSSRQQLLEVPRFGTKAFEQAAGFLRVAGAAHPLDATGVHPEQYGVLEEFAAEEGIEVSSLLGAGVARVRSASRLKERLGEFTFRDVIAELEKPGRDPRDPFVTMEFREGIAEMSDLVEGMVCPGVVTNVTNFGAFVDIGVHQDGLVHISQLSDTFVKDPRDVVTTGQRVVVRVLEVNLEKKQIALSMKAGDRTDEKSRGSSPMKSSGGDRRSKPARIEPDVRVAHTPFAALLNQGRR